MKHHRVRAVRQRQKRRSAAGVVIRCAAFLVLVIGCVLGLRWMGEETHSYAESTRPANFPSLATLGTLQPATIQARNRRLLYPYSVVPGGVRSADELQSASAHDPVVAEHYNGFDYKHARLVEVSQPKLVYLSYRRGDHIYWTRKQASLRVGEKLLTDGHTTARTRCGNQVSVLPQTETSPQEPTIAELDRPDAVASGREELFPSNLSTDLLPWIHKCHWDRRRVMRFREGLRREASCLRLSEAEVVPSRYPPETVVPRTISTTRRIASTIHCHLRRLPFRSRER